MLDHATLATQHALPAHELDWARLDRFLAFGCANGTYRTGDHEPTLEDTELVARCVAANGLRTHDRIVAASNSGRAPKNDPAIFSLAIAAKLGDEATRRAAYAALPKVCRTAAQLMRFVDRAKHFGGWGRGMRKAVGAWFNTLPAGELALQLATHPARDGWSNRDVLRLAHPRAASPSHDRLFAWAVRGELPPGANADPNCSLIAAIDELQIATDLAAAAHIIRSQRVPVACVPAKLMTAPEVWDALLAGMSLPAILRNLSAMTRVGLLTAGSAATKQVAAQLHDRTRLAGTHPFAVVATLVSYRAGRGPRGQGTWLPVASIVDALEAALTTSIAMVEPTGKRMLIALDVSGSMASGTVDGVANLTPRLASTAMAMVGAVDPATTCMAFTAAGNGFGGRWGGGESELTKLAITPRRRLDDVAGELAKLSMGGTDCALPMVWAQKHRVDVDAFVVYTDNETWAGNVPPAQALRAYRDARGIPAKLIVVGMTSTGFSVADPDDAGMLDVVGFDTSTPPVIADFVRV